MPAGEKVSRGCAVSMGIVLTTYEVTKLHVNKSYFGQVMKGQC
jgi:hypothetical protein